MIHIKDEYASTGNKSQRFVNLCFITNNAYILLINIKLYLPFLLLFLFFLWSCTETKQPSVPVNKSFAISNDISNQKINSIAEDALGHIWIATPRGANKHNVYEFHQYFSSDDTLSISGSQVHQIFRDSQNRLWFCTSSGVCIYTDKDCFQRIEIDTQSQNAMQILEDKQGRIFLNMVTELCEYDEKNNQFRVVIPDFDNDEKWNNHCFIGAQGDLWSVSGSYIRSFDTDTKRLKSRTHFGNFIHYAFLRNNSELWIASGATLSVFDTESREMMETPDVIRRHPVLSQTVTTYIHPYSDYELLISTHHGLFLYNFLSQTVVHQSEDGFPFVAPDFKITTMLTDSQKNLWIGSYDQGFVVKYGYKERFNNNSYLISQFENKSVTSITSDRNENLWMTTSLDGIFLYDIQNKLIRPIDISTLFPENKFFTNHVKSIFIDSEGFMWLITETDRLIKCSFDGQHLRIINDYSLQTSITAMTEDNNGTIYAIGFNHNIYFLQKGDIEFRQKQLYTPGIYVFTSALKKLADGNLLISSFAQNILIINPENWNIEEIDFQDTTSSVVVPTVVFEDSQGDIWIGTRINGLYLYRRKTNELIVIEETSCTDISAIQEDIYGDIWISTFFGLSKYDRSTEKMTNYYKNDGIGGNQFNERSVCQLSDGMLIFGGTHGLTFFNPSQLTVKHDIPLVFGNLTIHNQLELPYQSNSIDRHLSYQPTIRLKHKQNSFSISFTALDYSKFERMNYEYMLEGYDKMWIDAGNKHEAHYSALSAGKYVFRVKMYDKDNRQIEAVNDIKLHILPAPEASGWAISLYFILFASATFFTVRYWQKINKARKNVLQIQHEKEQNELVNRMKMNFFANVSHEFRTPLTMISGPINTLCKDEKMTGENRKILYIVQRSVDRMLKLVSQLLDVNKLENDALRLKVCQTDIISFLNHLIDIFKLNAINKNINLFTIALEDSFRMWLDVDKVDKIMGNLLANALKFTPSGGKIVVSFDVMDDYVSITVKDTGIGIPEDELEKIFDRYYQVNQTESAYTWGTGIGLYYAQRLAEMHHGYINATNAPEGGSIFTLMLPVNENAYSHNEKIVEKEDQIFIFPLHSEEQYYGKPTGSIDKEKPKILIVDDDSDIVHYLETLLSPHYNVIACFNALNALKIIEEEAPELILSDVMMPNMSGYEFCQAIKSNILLCHIPVVLVTAKTRVENQVEGLDSGADAYITKPFDPAYLIALIKSQLKNRENVRRLLGRETKTDNIIKENMLSPQDDAFMTELYRLMETELSNPELNISRMTQALNISRTKLYYKIKGLTGNNPNVFFKTYKLNRAAELMRERKLNISEISDITGFSTLPHFSASFKKHFGMPPSKYLNLTENE